MRSSQSEIGVPLNAMMRSPARSPACAAGDGGRPLPQSARIVAGTQVETWSIVLVTVPARGTPSVIPMIMSSTNANTKLATTPR